MLLEGVPGVAKTTLVKAFATALGVSICAMMNDAPEAIFFSSFRYCGTTSFSYFLKLVATAPAKKFVAAACVCSLRPSFGRDSPRLTTAAAGRCTAVRSVADTCSCVATSENRRGR